MSDQHSSKNTGDPMDLKVVQLAAQLLKNGFDNVAEREQLQQPARRPCHVVGGLPFRDFSRNH
jgi:hypothetical protein